MWISAYSGDFLIVITVCLVWISAYSGDFFNCYIKSQYVWCGYRHILVIFLIVILNHSKFGVDIGIFW